MSDSENSSTRVVRSREIAAVFDEALGQEPGAEREQWLRERCGADAQLLLDVQALLDADLRAGAFLGDSETTEGTTSSPSANNSLPHGDIQPGSILGPYKLLQRLGEGGFGEVFLAEQEEPVRRQVALKIIKPGMDSREIMARFEAERQALAMMDHPNIATVLDAGSTETGRPYFVMELVRGVKITRFCDQEQLNTEARLTLFTRVCSAIQHAHQKGVIHRDIKPSNILVTSYDGVPVPKVIDFGIAKAMQQKLTKKTLFTRYEQFIGTPAYMSPEQAEHSGLDLDTRADVYALGVLLYELLVGITPFDPGEWAKIGFDEIRRRIREDIPKKPSTRLAALSSDDRTTVSKHRRSDPTKLSRLVNGDLDWIVMRALEKDRRRRYESPSALARDIERFRAHESIEARPPSTGYRMTQFFRRHRLASLAGLFSLLSLLIGLAVSIYGLKEANKGRMEAETNLGIAKENEAEARAQSARADSEAAAVRRLLYPNILDAATEALRDGKRRRAAELLATCPEAERGWEWQRIANRLIDPSQIFHAATSPSKIRDLRSNPNGKQILAAFDDGSIRLWNQSAELLTTLKPSNSPIMQAAFTRAGDQVLSLSQDNTLRYYALQSEQEVDRVAHSEQFRSAALGSQGSYLLTHDRNGRIMLWTRPQRSPVAVMEDRVFDLTCSAVDSETGLSAAGTRSGMTAVWDPSGIRLWETNPNQTSVSALRFSPDGTLLVTGDEFGRIQVFSAESGRNLAGWTAHRRQVTAISFTDDGETLASAGQEGGVSIRDIASGRELGYIVGDENGVSHLLFSQDDATLIVGGATGMVREFPLDQLATPNLYLGHRDLVFETALAPDSRTLVSGSRDGTIRIWDLRTGVELKRIRSHADAVLSVDVSQDGQWIASRGDDSVVRVRKFDTGELIWQQAVNHRVRHLCFHPNGKYLVAGAQPPTGDSQNTEPIVAIWDIQQKREVIRFEGHRGEVLRMAYSPGARLLATSSAHAGSSTDGRVLVWDVTTGKIINSLRPSPDAVSHSVAWSSDGNRIYTGHGDGRVCFWTKDGEQERTVYAHGEPIGALCVSPDGATLATGAWYNGEMKLWNAATGELRDTVVTEIPGISDIRHDLSGDAWVICGLDGELIRLPSGWEENASFLRQRQAASAARRALLNEEIILSGVGDLSGFQSAVETLVRDQQMAWQLSDRGEDFKPGPEERAATSLEAIAEEYLRSDLFDEAFLAMERCLELAPNRFRENRLRWIEEAQALEEGMGQELLSEDFEDYLGGFGDSLIRENKGKLVYQDNDLEEEWELLPVKGDMFQFRGDATSRLEFIRSSSNDSLKAIRLKRFSGREDLLRRAEDS